MASLGSQNSRNPGLPSGNHKTMPVYGKNINVSKSALSFNNNEQNMNQSQLLEGNFLNNINIPYSISTRLCEDVDLAKKLKVDRHVELKLMEQLSNSMIT